jgi:ribosomal-protein-alanine N-acetyltransferase
MGTMPPQPRSSGEVGDTGVSRSHLVVLPSGRVLDLCRSRWDGVLDREELDHCRRSGIRLAYDCAQIGWVTLACTDDPSDVPTRPAPRAAPVIDLTADPERRAEVLRRSVDADAQRTVIDVRDGRLSADAAQRQLVSTATALVERVADEHGLSTADRCHGALQASVARALATVRGPIHSRPSAVDADIVTFRPWTLDDAGVYLELLGNPKVWEYLPEPFPDPFTEDTARALIEVAGIGFHHETVAVVVDGRPIGQCLLRFSPPFAGTQAAEVAYWLGEQHWGKGWMSRILPRFTERSFRRHPLDVIYAWIMTGNEASVRVAEHAGYRRDHFPRESQLAASLHRPGYVRYATYRTDWWFAQN